MSKNRFSVILGKKKKMKRLHIFSKVQYTLIYPLACHQVYRSIKSFPFNHSQNRARLCGGIEFTDRHLGRYVAQSVERRTLETETRAGHLVVGSDST